MTVRSDSPRRAWGAPLRWCALLLGLVAFNMSPQWHPVQSNDNYQYLSIASNFERGYIGQTSLIYFDEERRHGTIPAPMATFPVGYPAMIAALDALVHSVEIAALLVSPSAWAPSS